MVRLKSGMMKKSKMRMIMTSSENFFFFIIIAVPSGSFLELMKSSMDKKMG
jgi:hypothetical protein